MYHLETSYRRKLFALKESFKVGDVVEIVDASEQGPISKKYIGEVGIVLTKKPDGIDYSCGNRFIIGVIIGKGIKERIKSYVNFHVLDLKRLDEAR